MLESKGQEYYENINTQNTLEEKTHRRAIEVNQSSAEHKTIKSQK